MSTPAGAPTHGDPSPAGTGPRATTPSWTRDVLGDFQGDCREDAREASTADFFPGFWMDAVAGDPGIAQSAPVNLDGMDPLPGHAPDEGDAPWDLPWGEPWGEPWDGLHDGLRDGVGLGAPDGGAPDGGSPVAMIPSSQVIPAIRAGIALGQKHGSWLTGLSGSGLADLVEAADRAVAVWDSVRARAVLEAEERDVIRQAGCSTPVWITRHAPSLRQGGAYALARLVKMTRQGRRTGLAGSDPVAALDPDSPLGIVWEHITGSALNVASALGVLSEAAVLAPRLVPEAIPTVTRGLCLLAGEQGLREMKRLRPALLARHGAPGEIDDLQEKLASCAVLSSPGVCSTGLTEYALRLTPAQAAVLEAAIGPLAAPRPNPDTGETDLRPAGQRRAEALAEVLARGAALHTTTTPSPSETDNHADDTSPSPSVSSPSEAGSPSAGPSAGKASGKGKASGTHGTPGEPGTAEEPGTGIGPAASAPSPRSRLVAVPGLMATALPSSTALYVTIGLQSLLAGIGAGEVIGSRAAGTFLSPAQVRRLACDAEIIPTVLGSQSQILDQGRATRLFDPAQRRALWHRDRGCTYPGCSAPPTWTRAHHIRHWLDHGPSDLSNATLLCQRHHTLVHQRRLAATVSPVADERGRYVHWDLSPGSYAYDR